MPNLIAIYGSPRRKGNTALLLREAVQGARDAGAHVDEVVLRDLKISPCLEIYGCRKTGRCVIQDDFQKVYDQMMASQGIMLASPIFFYSVSAHTKTFMDRCQSLWVKKYWSEEGGDYEKGAELQLRRGLFISVGATKGKRLFDGTMLTVRYFFDVLDVDPWDALLYRSLDFEGEVLNHPEYLEEARQAGGELVRGIEGSG